MEDLIVVSNNPLIKDLDKVLFVEGNFRAVLLQVRDLVYIGHILITHPLFSSIGMMFSPYRTVLVGKKEEKPDMFFCQMIENAINEYDKTTTGNRNDEKNKEDYALIDKELFEAALEEYKTLYSK